MSDNQTVSEIAKKKASEYMTDKDKIVGYVAVHGDVLGQTLSEALNIPIEKVFRYLSELTTTKIIVAEGSPSRYNVCSSKDIPATKPPVEQSSLIPAKAPVKSDLLTPVKSLVELVADVLKKAVNPMDVAEIAKELDKSISGVHNALTYLKNTNRVEKIGQRPFHYSLTAEKGAVQKTDPEPLKFQINEGESNTSVVKRFMKSHTEYMNVEEIAHLVGLRHSQVSPIISTMKKNGGVDIIGIKGPFKYRLCTKERVPEKVEEKKPVVKEVLPEKVKEKKPVVKKPVKAEQVIHVRPFDDYLIGYTVEKSDKPVFITQFKDTADFINQFEDLQKIEGVDEICAFKRLTLSEKTIFTPDV